MGSPISELTDEELKIGRANNKLSLNCEKFNFTDVGNAERFAAYRGDRVRYCSDFKKWMLWDGRIWHEDRENRITQEAKIVARTLYADAAENPNTEKRKLTARYAIKLEANAKIKAMLEIAKSELPILPETFDCDPYLLNVQNGILNLHSGELSQHDPNRFMTKICNAEFHKDAPCERWIKFLNEIMNNDKELILYLQKAVGLTLLGQQLEHVIFILYGTGANGKSTFLNAVSHVLGDYAQTAQMEVLLQKWNSNAISNDIARMRGARLVTSTEAGENRSFNESLLKILTGNDVVAARLLYQQTFDFRPQLTLVIGVNHKPNIRETSYAMWRRIKIIPFEVTILKENQNPKLFSELKEEANGILAWAFEGLKAYFSEHLLEPAKIEKAIAEYKTESDQLGDFIKEYCILSGHEKAKVLYEKYKEWATMGGEVILSQTKFGRALRERGFGKKNMHGIVYTGISFRDFSEEVRAGIGK